MGFLAESKRRRKIPKDPNNTKWSRDTSTFGQKILRSQGWEPGQFLGAKDARHSGLLTAANASGIRVSLKDDVKGLGFDKAKEDQVTGLDVFSDLLSRLNGKSEEDIEDAKQARLVMKTNLYVERKWGTMRFVRGGVLVGDTVKAGMTEEASAAPAAGKKERKSKKRKLGHDEHQDVATDSKGEKKRCKEERRARRAPAIATPDSTHEANPDSDSKAKKEKMTKKPIEDLGDDVDAEQDQTEPADETPPRKVRKSKRQVKEAAELAVDEEDTKAERRPKKRKKEKKSRSKAGETQKTLSTKQADGVGSVMASGASTPAEPDAGTWTPKGRRNFVRSRFIAAKRQALLDAKVLDQVCPAFISDDGESGTDGLADIHDQDLTAFARQGRTGFGRGR